MPETIIQNAKPLYLDIDAGEWKAMEDKMYNGRGNNATGRHKPPARGIPIGNQPRPRPGEHKEVNIMKEWEMREAEREIREREIRENERELGRLDEKRRIFNMLCECKSLEELKQKLVDETREELANQRR